MRDIVRSEVGRSFSPGFGCIRILPKRRARLPLWLAPVAVLALAGLVAAIVAAH